LNLNVHFSKWTSD